jgi:PAS domain S-box-containing protein
LSVFDFYEIIKDNLPAKKNFMDKAKSKKKDNKHIAARAFSTTEELQRILFEEATEGIFIADSQGRYIAVNARVSDLTGYSVEEFLGMNIKDLIHPEDLVKDPIHMDELRQGKIVRSERRIVRKDGTLFTVEISARMQPEGNLLGVVHDISARKQAETALRESEEKYRQLVETTGTGYVIIDGQGLVIDANQEYVLLTGRQRLEDVVGHNVLEWTAPNCLEYNAAAVRQCAEQGFIRNLEIDYFSPMGQITPVELNATVFHASGAVRILTLCRNITERRSAEKERKAHIRFLENLERIDQTIKQEFDVESMLRHILETVFSIFGCDRVWLFYPCDPDAPTFRVPVIICRPEYAVGKVLNGDLPLPPDMAHNLREALVSPVPVIYIAGTERPINKVTAEVFGVQSQMFVALYPRLGKPWVFGMHQCSSPRIWTKEEQKLFTEIARRISDGLSSVLILRELRENEERFRATFEQAAVGIAHVALDGRWLRVNQRLCDIVGYPREELLQKTFKDITHPEDLDLNINFFQQALAGKIPMYSMEKRYIRKNGALVWINLTVSIVRQASGEPAYLIAVIEDISTRKKAEEEKEKLQGQLLQAQKMESVGRLAGGVAHDFNNMLGVILGHSELALRQVAPAQPLYDNLEEIQKAGQRAADLTRQLLAFARKQAVSPKVLDLNDTVANMISMLRRLIGENIELTWSPGKDLWSVKIDPSQFDQVLANLCVNARDACVGTCKVVIETSNIVFDEGQSAIHMGFVPGEYVQLAVSDSGSGMEKEVLEHLFEPFFTTKGLGQGTGLGLSTVYGIVKQNSGFINVYSEPGIGTTFKIYFPRVLGKQEHVSDLGQPQKLKGGKETILLVEDEVAILDLSKTMLESFGYRVLAAGSPREALALAKENPGEIDLLMTDVVMPGMTGRDLSQQLLSLYPKMKRLFMSGYTDDIIADHGILGEGVCFLQKPFSLATMSAKVREALGQKA